jgi:hypothetical protein
MTEDAGGGPPALPGCKKFTDTRTTNRPNRLERFADGMSYSIGLRVV